MTNTIKKVHVEATANFAIKNIPQVNEVTLEKFVELVYTDGNYGEITHEQLLSKMCLALKYIPQACAKTLLILADLLEIPVPIMTEEQLSLLPAATAINLAAMSPRAAAKTLTLSVQ